MKLLFVNSAHESLWGGGEKWTISAAEWFAKVGHQTRVVGRPNSKLLAAAATKNIPGLATTFGGDFDPQSIGRAWSIIRKHRPDLVVVNFNKEGFHFGVAGKILDVPVVARHGFPLLRNAAHHRWLMNSLYSELIVNANSIREAYATLGFAVSNVPIIHNGVLPSAPDRHTWRTEWQIYADQPLIVAAGRLESQKRFDRFLEIARLISTSLPEARFAIVGDGPFISELKAQSAKLELTSTCHFAGFDAQFAARIAAADLFLLTSEDEGTPNVVLEALSAGVPTIAMTCGALPAILSGSLSDNLLEQNDIAGMSRRAVELLTNKSLHDSVSAQSREQIQMHFSFEGSMRAFEQRFQRVVAARA